MSQKNTTICDNCGAETTDAKGDGWSRNNTHPWESGPVEPGSEPDPASWLIRDLCSTCSGKFRAWALGELKIVFHRPRRKRGSDEQGRR